MSKPSEKRFDNRIPTDWELHDEIEPRAKQMSMKIAQQLAVHDKPGTEILEIGCGTGDTTAMILSETEHLRVVGIDNEPKMIQQAAARLNSYIRNDRLHLNNVEALIALQEFADERFDVVASVYTLHNMKTDHRERVQEEIFRVLKPGGLFVNGDRYWLSSSDEHLEVIADDVKSFVRVLVKHNRPDLLEDWMIHFFQDQSRDYRMIECEELEILTKIGFCDTQSNERGGMNLLVSACKPPLNN